MNTRRPHSPDYPAIGLAEAVVRCKKLFDVLQMRAATRDTVGAGLGFPKMHGGAMSSLAAIRKFGLLTRVGENLALTELAKNILLPKSDAELAFALKEAALKPELFKQLYDMFGPEIKDDSIVTNHLLREDFLPDAARKALRAYKETIAYLPPTILAAHDASGYNAPSRLEGEGEAMLTDTMPEPVCEPRTPPVAPQPATTTTPPPSPAATPATAQPPPPPLDGERELMNGLLSRSVSYRLIVRGGAGPKELGNLIKILEAQKKVLEEDPG